MSKQKPSYLNFTLLCILFSCFQVSTALLTTASVNYLWVSEWERWAGQLCLQRAGRGWHLSSHLAAAPWAWLCTAREPEFPGKDLLADEVTMMNR